MSRFLVVIVFRLANVQVSRILCGDNVLSLQTNFLVEGRPCYTLAQRQMKLFTAFFVLFVGLLHVQLVALAMPFYLAYFVCLVARHWYVTENGGLLSIQSKIIVNKIL